MKLSGLKIINVLVFTILLVGILPEVEAQKVQKVNMTGSTMVIKGTSNLHDWESKVQQISGQVTTKTNGNTLESLTSVTITIPVSSIKSGKSIMDSKTYDALNNEKFPSITFIAGTGSIQAGNVISTSGKLTVAGVTRDVTLKVTYSVAADGQLKVKGSTKFKMTDFKVNPPTALLGTLKTGNEVEIVFDVNFK